MKQAEMEHLLTNMDTFIRYIAFMTKAQLESFAWVIASLDIPEVGTQLQAIATCIKFENIPVPGDIPRNKEQILTNLDILIGKWREEKAVRIIRQAASDIEKVPGKAKEHLEKVRSFLEKVQKP